MFVRFFILIVCFLSLFSCSSFANLEQDFDVYMELLKTKVQLNWDPPKASSYQKVVVFFSVDRNGNIFDEKILQTSGKIDFDDSALKAVRESSPLNPLPVKYKGKKVNIEFTLDYNAYKNKNHSLLRKRTDSLLR